MFSLVANRLLLNRGHVFKRKLFRYPSALGLGGTLAYLFNLFVLRPIYLNDIEELGLAEKYFFLDLNADMMENDLEQFGFKIKAKHFNLE